MLAFKFLQPVENFFQEDQAVINLPIPAVEFPEQDPNNHGPGSDQNIA